jgi:lysozyme family protein
MTELDWQKSISKVLQLEGGNKYTNHKEDSGRGTRYGITDVTYSAFRKSMNMPEQSVLHIEYPAEVYKIYKTLYWIPAGCDKMSDPKYAFVLFDFCVNSGLSRAKNYHKIAKGDVKKLITLRREFYNKIVKNNPSQIVFLKGWMNRIDHVEKYVAAWDLIKF